MSVDQSLWPVTVRLSEVRQAEKRSLTADDATRARIAKALSLVSLDRLEAELKLAPWFDGVQIDGRWRAAVVQTCGVTLEPLNSDLSGDFMVRVVPAGSDLAPVEGDEAELDLEADDPPDVAETDDIDLGGYVVEHLALEIDPFPRKPGVVFEPPADTEERSPFAVLKRLTDSPPKE